MITSEIFIIGNREQWWLLYRAELFEILKTLRMEAADPSETSVTLPIYSVEYPRSLVSAMTLLREPQMLQLA